MEAQDCEAGRIPVSWIVSSNMSRDSLTIREQIMDVPSGEYVRTLFESARDEALIERHLRILVDW